MDIANDNTDPRTASPPYGYSRVCTHSHEQQIHIVAEYHANKIRPSRIAFRVGIDIALVEALIAGEEEVGRFERLVANYRKRRYKQRMRDSTRKKGIAQYEMQQKIDKEFKHEAEF
jgi:hypothetical protein